MKLPDIRDFDLKGKGVLLRADLDVPLKKVTFPDGSFEQKILDESRLESFIPTLNLILERNARYVLILGHLGRYEQGREGISTFTVWPAISRLAKEPVTFWPVVPPPIREAYLEEEEDRISLGDNLRLVPDEEQNNLGFSKRLAADGNFYINDAFAVSHREHASIVGLPKLLPHAAGLNLLKEVEVLSKVLEQPKKPLVFILGGVKEDKLEVISPLLSKADYILVGGRLPLLMEARSWKLEAGKVVVGELNRCGKDITLETVEKFQEIISKAGTIVWAGPLGMFEEKDWELGTKMVGMTVVCSKAFTVIGGGDTEAALTKFGLVDKIDFVSSGGGAMLEFLAYGDLPGLRALRG